MGESVLMKNRNKKFYVIYIIILLVLAILSSFDKVFNMQNVIYVIASYLLACECTRGE